MKSTLKYFAAAFAIVAAVACSKELSSTDDINFDDQPKVQMTFTASIGSDIKTKTALNNKLLEWTAGDKITLYGNGVYNTADGYNVHKGYCTIEESSISNDKTSAAFIGNVASSSDYCALYPAEGWTADGGQDYKYIFDGFAEQKAIKDSFDPSKHTMVAGSATNNRISFTNICALAKVTIATDLVYSVKIEGIAQFGSYGDYGSIGGPYGWKLNKSTNEYAPYSENKVHSITLKNENGAPLENGATYYIVLPACTIKNFTLSVCDQNGNILGTKSKTSDFDVKRNMTYDLGTLKVGVKYKKGNRIAKASDLQNNGSYIIEYLSDNQNCSNKYWTEMNDRSINLTSVNDGNFTANHIFITNMSYGSTEISGQTYVNKYRAAWKSLASGKYISGAFKAEFDESTYALYMIMANGWYRNYDYPTPQTGHDIDMYNGGDTNLKILYNGSNIMSNGSSCSKWHIYEAVIENTIL